MSFTEKMMKNKPRRSWVAAFLTILFSIGLGHIYSGRLKRGLILFAIGQLLFLASAISLTVIPPSAYYMAFLIGINFAYFVFCIFDAVAAARRGRKDYRLVSYNRWYVYVGFIVLAGLVDGFLIPGYISANYVQAFKMPTGSMEPTLLIGDRLLVNKRTYREGEPRRGDLIIFKYPEDPEVSYIKRLIGLPGEKIEIKERTVYINDSPIEEDYTQYINPGSLFDRYGPAYIPKKGDAIEFLESGTKVNGTVMYGEVVQSDQDKTASYTGPHVVSQNQYFAMGDNRDNSKDSRYWGTVPRDHLLGRVLIIYWSLETPRGEYLYQKPVDRLKRSINLLLQLRGKTRWDRIFMPIG
jgi:signal peptidase I